MASPKLTTIPALLCALELSAQGNANENPSQSESTEVKQSIIKMVNAIDTKQWALAQDQFTEEVYVDYSSLTGLPGSLTTSSNLVGGWEDLLKHVNTHHMLSNFNISITDSKAEVFSHVYASHTADGIDYWDAYGRYHHKLSKVEDEWLISSMTLIMHGQKGNTEFLNEVSKMKDTAMKKIEFSSEGEKVVGNLYFPKGYDANKPYPAVIVSGSWTTVKEQMSSLYAHKLADQGFITLAFDPRNFGESEGEIRFYEKPSQKIVDIKNAVTYLQSLPEVADDKIGALGICAGSMYTLMAAAEDKRIKSVVTAASWLHDAEAVKLFYGGEEGVQEKINAAQTAKQKYSETGEIEYIASISTTDPTAAMYGPYDYYLNPERGAVSEWSADKFAVMSWEDWLTLDPMPSAKNLSASTLMIHSDGAVLPEYTKQYFEKIASADKKLHWIETELESPYHQFNFYDQDDEVNESIKQASTWFSEKL
jgi:fermentation-respiration switch protein FrsA (DUF1100 family)